MEWWQWVIIILAGAAVAFGILSQTSWYKVRRYAILLKKINDKYKLEEKSKALEAFAQTPNPNPVLLRKPLREVIEAYEGIVAEMSKMKVPPKAQTLHELSLTGAKESLAMYQMAAVGGFRQKAIQEKYKKVQKTQELLQMEMERLYGKPKKKK